MRPSVQVLEVWGDLACFTRPELKVERFSYPVITPSAARAVFEAIYWKPQFRWQITKVEVLSELRYIALRRNEVKGKAPAPRTVEQWRLGKRDPEPLWADGEDEMTGRTQRQTMALKCVHYRLHAEIRPWPDSVPELPAMEAQFRRRASRGQCVYQPYLGCREFPAFFRLLEGDAPQPSPAALNLDIGLMLYDVFDLGRPGKSDDAPAISLFTGRIEDGVMRVPEYDDDSAVLKAVREER
jgi:CRISPR-associated protein Cas5d